MTLTDRLRAHLLALIGDRHPVSSPATLRQAEHYLVGQFQHLGLEVSSHPFDAFGGTYRNVVATLPASSRADRQEGAPPLIIAAHYDTVPGSPGADDNASGLAVILEVAHSLREGSLNREVRFIGFCLEEANLLGSLAYAAQLKAAKHEIIGAIVLECVGYARSEEGSQQVPPGIPITVPSVGNFLAIIGNTASADLTAAVERAAKPHLPVVALVVPGNGELLPDTRRSDHAAFWHHGFPAVMLTDTANFRNPHYHQPTDTLDTLDLSFLERVTGAVAAAVIDLAGTDRMAAR